MKGKWLEKVFLPRKSLRASSRILAGWTGWKPTDLNQSERRWKRPSYLVCRHKNIWIASGRSSSLLLTWDESSEGAVEVEGRSPRSFFAIIMLCILGFFFRNGASGVFNQILSPERKWNVLIGFSSSVPFFPAPPEEWRNSLAWQSDVPFICPCCMWRDRHAIWEGDCATRKSNLKLA